MKTVLNDVKSYKLTEAEWRLLATSGVMQSCGAHRNDVLMLMMMMSTMSPNVSYHYNIMVNQLELPS